MIMVVAVLVFLSVFLVGTVVENQARVPVETRHKIAVAKHGDEI